MTNFDWSKVEKPSPEFEEARKADYRLREAGFRVTCNSRSDRKWQCAIEMAGTCVTAIGDTWEAAIIAADDNLAHGIAGPPLEML